MEIKRFKIIVFYDSFLIFFLYLLLELSFLKDFFWDFKINFFFFLVVYFNVIVNFVSLLDNDFMKYNNKIVFF